MTQAAQIAGARVIHRSPFVYGAYGLRVLSDIALPELSGPEADLSGQPCVRIAVGPVALPDGIKPLAAWFDFSPAGTRFHWADVGSFHVSACGAQVTVAPSAGVGDDLVAFPLLGPVLSECLRRAGLFVLHASAVNLGGAGITLMADKGTGKSTTAAALVRAGARLLADDLVAFAPQTGLILPGFGQIKLSSEALAAVAPSGAAPRGTVHAAIDKTRLLVQGHLSFAAVPSRRLYVLQRGGGEAGQITSPGTAEALPLILRFSYAARFGAAALTGPAAAQHFLHAAALAARGGVRVLHLPEGLGHLADVRALIEADLAGPAAP